MERGAERSRGCKVKRDRRNTQILAILDPQNWSLRPLGNGFAGPHPPLLGPLVSLVTVIIASIVICHYTKHLTIPP